MTSSIRWPEMEDVYRLSLNCVPAFLVMLIAKCQIGIFRYLIDQPAIILWKFLSSHRSYLSCRWKSGAISWVVYSAKKSDYHVQMRQWTQVEGRFSSKFIKINYICCFVNILPCFLVNWVAIAKCHAAKKSKYDLQMRRWIHVGERLLSKFIYLPFFSSWNEFPLLLRIHNNIKL